MSKSRSWVMGLGLFTTLGFMGCAGPSKREQLESVAKDWCMTIRASQVIPVYPLTEDLRPGDVFVVEVPVQKQAEIYEKKGFLPLDRIAVRLSRNLKVNGMTLPDIKEGYKDFYRPALLRRTFR